jgi:hypothetical protein
MRGGGKVMGPRVVGATLTTLHVHGMRSQELGGGEVDRREWLEGGVVGSSGDGSTRWLGVDRVEERGHGFGRGGGLHRATVLPRVQLEKTEGRGISYSD